MLPVRRVSIASLIQQLKADEHECLGLHMIRAKGIVRLFGEEAHEGAWQGRDCAVSRCDLGTRLPAPHPEGTLAGTPVMLGAYQVPPRPEVTGDEGVGREEPLCLPG